jgi:tetratricopeptide (TPR) repeat protein
MTITKSQKIIGSVAIIIVLLILYVVFDRRAKNAQQADNLTTVQTIATTTGGNLVTNGTGKYTVERVPLTEGDVVPQPIPNLTAKITFSSSVSLTDEQKQMVQQKISALQALLVKHPVDFNSWIDLGIYQKMAGDYNATIASWQYAGKISPTNFISFGDLGDLSAYFLKDTASAEKYYKQAIANGPTQVYLYIQLAQVQNDIEKDATKALATINQGLAKIPNDPSLLQYKANLSK